VVSSGISFRKKDGTFSTPIPETICEALKNKEKGREKIKNEEKMIKKYTDIPIRIFLKGFSKRNRDNDFFFFKGRICRMGL
jgi:hypothetical protein